MTPDGISDDGWGRIHQLALDVVNARGRGEPEAGVASSLELRESLDELQEKYGPLPSLLATRADYAEAAGDREYWFLAAYHQAQERGDLRNLVMISESLASFYVEEQGDFKAGAEWLAALECHLLKQHEDYEAEEAVRLRALLDRGSPADERAITESTAPDTPGARE